METKVWSVFKTSKWPGPSFLRGKSRFNTRTPFYGSKKAVKQSKGGGARSVAHTLRQEYSAVSEASVRDTIDRSETHGYSQAKFSNKPPFKSIQTSSVFQRVQIDLLKMKEISFEGQSFRYILTAVDVFSRYLFCRALANKTDDNVAAALQSIFSEHGWPNIIQCDNGPEFRGKVISLLRKKNVKIVHGRAYHPQSQGKVERQNRIIRSKLRYEIARKGRRGYNWVEGLSELCGTINRHCKELLGYQTPFSVYYGRNREGGKADQIRTLAQRASARCAKRALVQRMRRNPCSVYKIGDKVLVRYPFGSRVPYKRHILPGKIVRRSRGYDRYVVKFRKPEGVLVRQWVGVENITSRTLAEENHRRNVSVDIFSNLERKKNREKYYIVKENTHDSDSVSVYANERDESISNTSSDDKMKTFCRNKDLLVDYDPTEVGNCQFSSVSHQLRRVGLNRSASQLRKDAVDHLTRHSEYYQDFVEGK